MDSGIVLKITSEVREVDGASERTEFTTLATLTEKGGKMYIRYDESEMTGMAGTKTMVVASGDTVTIKRYGSIDSTLRIERGASVENRYRTPYGFLFMTTVGKTFTLSQNPFKLNFTYELITEDGGIQSMTLELLEVGG